MVKAVWMGALGAFLVLPSTVQAVEWHGQVVQKDGVPHYMNPSLPIDSPVVLAARELWSLGGDDESEEEFFGVISSVQQGADGTVYLLDAQLSEVKAYTADGAYLRTLGREGEGPGEFRRPMDLLLLPNGNIGVIQARPARVVALTPDGSPAEDLVPGSTDPNAMVMSRAGQAAGSRVVLQIDRMERGSGSMTRNSALAAYDLSGKLLTTYHELSGSIDFANPVFKESDMQALRVWKAGPDGRVYRAAPDGSYTIFIHNPEGAVEKVYAANKEPRVRSAEEKAEAKSRIVIRGPMNPTIQVSDTSPAIIGLFLRDNGELWVLNDMDNYKLPKGIAASFDVFNAKGEYVRRIQVRGDFDVQNDLVTFCGDTLFVVRRYAEARAAMMGRGEGEAEEDLDDAEPIEVVAYQLEPSSAGGSD